MTRFRLSASVAALVFCAVSPAFPAQPLDGWNGYKFGLSPDDVRAVPGIVFGPYSAKNMMNQDVGSMASVKPVSVNGMSFTLSLYFDPPKKLSQVSLENETKTSQADCEKRFVNVLTQFNKTYGGFAPFSPQRAKKNDSDQLPSTVVWKNQGALRYQLTSVPMADETASVWAARKTDGARFLNISGTWSAKDTDTSIPCVVTVDFSVS